MKSISNFGNNLAELSKVQMAITCIFHFKAFSPRPALFYAPVLPRFEY